MRRDEILLARLRERLGMSWKGAGVGEVKAVWKVWGVGENESEIAGAKALGRRGTILLGWVAG